MEIFIEDFKRNFNTYKELPIVLYGIGEKTKIILENVKGFNFIGLMDKEATGQIIYGQKVISAEEAIEKAKLIIIVANMSVVDIIFKRISFIQKQYKIKILYINGEEPKKFEIKEDEYFNTSYLQLISEIEKHDVISFDLFDTLIMRKVLEPKDIFLLVQEKIKRNLNLNLPFYEQRISAENKCRHYLDENCTINQIYDKISEMLELDIGVKHHILNLEIETEIECIMQRNAIVEVFNHAKNLGKTLCITTDMYLPKTILEIILENNGIKGYDQLLISCEEKKSKYTGDLYCYIKSLYPHKKVIHIGDSKYSDIKMAQKMGVDTFQVYSAYHLASISSISYIMKYSADINNRFLLGNIFAELFNNPFTINETNGILSLRNMYEIGKIVFAPIVIRFIYEVIYKSKEKHIDKLLFFARDGYIFKQAYEKMVINYNLDVPKAIYFYTSRRAASLASIEDTNDIIFIIKNLCKIKKEKIKNILFTAFDININSNDEIAQKYYYEIKEQELIQYVIENYKEQIFENARREKRNYLNYIEDIKINKEDQLGCINFIGRGMTQYFVTKIIKKEMEGYYFATESDISKVFNDLSNIHGIYGELISPYTSNCIVANKYLFGEVIFSSPEGQLVRFDENGNCILQDRDLKYEYIQDSHLGILNLLKEFLDMKFGFNKFNWDYGLVQELYGLISSEKCIISDDIKKRFHFGDYYSSNILGKNLYKE